jgi:cellulose synthase/poly-beta-1,6-N-acetylglucosamine synthase-like glycosyltransferase
MHHSTTKRACVSAIVPARNEEAVIAGCVRSLAVQKEIAEVLVIDDQSTDRTAEIVRGLAAEFSKVRLLEAMELPAGWVGKNNAVWMGAKEARGEWLLFTDADAVHEPDSVAKALQIAAEQNAALVSFSPEQVMGTWYEKAVIPYVYTRLASKYRFDEVNDPNAPAAAANGQFLVIRRDAYEAVGGHARVAGEVLEDVALAKLVKEAGYRIWFGSGKGIVRVRMYRTFAAMWEGWRKNLYLLMRASSDEAVFELTRALLPLLLILPAVLLAWRMTRSMAFVLAVLAAGFLGLFSGYAGELKRNGFPVHLVIHGITGRLLFAAMLSASYRSYQEGRLKWKGRAYPANPRRI